MLYFVKKPCFTLLELLIVLFIISFGVILTGVKVNGIYREQRFLSETQQVLSRLAMAQDLMLISDADVQVKIAPDADSQLQVWLEVEKPFEEPWARFIEKKLTLQAIRSFEFQENHGKELSLRFSFGRMSKGTLTLYEGEKNSSSEGRAARIELTGMPRPLKIKSGEEKEAFTFARRQSEKGKVLYPAEVYEILYEDPDKEKETL